MGQTDCVLIFEKACNLLNLGDKIMKIMFLDVNGVMCTLRSHFAFGGSEQLMQAWDITVCQMLRVLCNKCNLKIVITSTWRIRCERLRTHLATYELIESVFRNKQDDVLDDNSVEWKTKRLPHSDDSSDKHRGLEIQEWLDRHPKVTDYIIIDDDSDMLDSQMNHFFKVVDGYEGFSSRNFIDICNYFKVR